MPDRVAMERASRRNEIEDDIYKKYQNNLKRSKTWYGKLDIFSQSIAGRFIIWLIGVGMAILFSK